MISIIIITAFAIISVTSLMALGQVHERPIIMIVAVDVVIVLLVAAVYQIVRGMP